MWLPTVDSQPQQLSSSPDLPASLSLGCPGDAPKAPALGSPKPHTGAASKGRGAGPKRLVLSTCLKDGSGRGLERGHGLPRGVAPRQVLLGRAAAGKAAGPLNWASRECRRPV